MKFSGIILSLALMVSLGLAMTGCDSTEPAEMGKVQAPVDGDPRGGNLGDPDLRVVGDEYGGVDGRGIDGRGGRGGRGGANTADGANGGKPTGWQDGADKMGHRPGEFSPVPGLHFEPIYFEYDRSDLRASEMDKLQKVADFLRSRPELGLIIEGHCDDRGSEEYNRALGERRAISLRNQLVKMGVPDENMKTISYGKDRPAVQGNSAEARAKNRRGETIPAKMQ